MINEEKVKIMTKIAMYEQGKAEDTFRSASIIEAITSDWL